MEDLPLGRIAALVPEFAVKDLPLGRTLMMIMMILGTFLLLMVHEQWDELGGRNDISLGPITRPRPKPYRFVDP